jgi:hypothetical protein
MPLTAASEVPAGQTNARELQVLLRIKNPEDHKIEILNPDMGVPSPAINWAHSADAYRTLILQSFGYLSMLVTDDTGQEPPRQAFLVSATPALRPPLELRPGDSFEMAIPIGSFYRLASGKTYGLALEYGDRTLKVSARITLAVRPDGATGN